MKEAIKDYVNYIYIEKKLSDNTKKAYEHDLILFSDYINNKNVNHITTNDIKNYI